MGYKYDPTKEANRSGFKAMPKEQLGDLSSFFGLRPGKVVTG